VKHATCADVAWTPIVARVWVAASVVLRSSSSQRPEWFADWTLPWCEADTRMQSKA
jgi:hypothetical protein